MHTHTPQEALACLERLPELSQRGQVLQSQASVLLADVSCVQGGEVGGEMVGVFQGLISMLKEQVCVCVCAQAIPSSTAG